MRELEHDERREKDVQSIVSAILNKNVEQIGDSGDGGQCPFCYVGCRWDANMDDVNHSRDCAYLIAKDLNTNK